MFIAEVHAKGKAGKTYRSILLRQSLRVGPQVKSKTLAVLTHLPAHVLEAVRRALQGPPADSLAQVARGSSGALRLRNAESFGALWTVEQVARQLGLPQALGVTRQAQLAYWQVLARVLRPRTSLLAMVRLACSCAAAALLRWRLAFCEDDLYANGAWLEKRHASIERRLWESRPDKSGDQLFLYDVTSSYLEGQHNELGDWGYNRDGKRGKQQLVVGLLTDAHGEPCAIQVYRGNTSDLKTFGQQVHQLKADWGCQGVTLVGDRGMIRRDQMAEAKAAGFHYITALTKPQIQKLLATNVLQLELFEETLCEVISQAGQRYLLRRNPLRQQELAQGRQHKKQALLQAVQKANAYLDHHPRAKLKTQRTALEAKLKRLQVADWLRLGVRRNRLSLKTDPEALKTQEQLDGCYVVHTDLQPAQADAQTVHDRYKDLTEVERDFRTLKTGHLEFRPWFVCTGQNTQAHALTAMLALKVRRHLDKAWGALNLTVEEGLRELETLCVQELVHPQTQAVVARRVPEPSQRQKQLLDALKLTAPTIAPEASVSVGTRKKIGKERQVRAK